MPKKDEQKNIIDSISEFVNKNSKHGFEIVMLGLANIVLIFLIFLANQNSYIMWGVFCLVAIEIIIASIIHYKKETYKLKNDK